MNKKSYAFLHSHLEYPQQLHTAYISCILPCMVFPPKVEHRTKIKHNKISGSMAIHMYPGHSSFKFYKVIILHVLVELFLSKSFFNFMINNDIPNIFLYSHCSPSRGYPKKSLMSFSPCRAFLVNLPQKKSFLKNSPQQTNSRDTASFIWRISFICLRYCFIYLKNLIYMFEILL